jgi:SAM-dependent methyltransferase
MLLTPTTAPSLDEAVDQFIALDDPGAIDRTQDPRRFHTIIAAVHNLCGALLEGESAGVSRDQVLPRLAPVRAIHARSPFIARLQQWPRGYPGDFETIEYLWRGRNAAVDRTSFYLEHYALTAPVAEQHRQKVRRQAELIGRTLDRQGRVVLLACGSAPDLRLVVESSRLGSGVPGVPGFQGSGSGFENRNRGTAEPLEPTEPRSGSVLLNDMDPAALAYCRTALGPFADRCRFESGHALRILHRLTEPADLIMAGGLFDYLPDRACRAILSTARRRLAPGGRLFFTNIAIGNPYRPWLEYCGEWSLIERTEEQVRALVDNEDGGLDVQVERDVTGLTLLVTVSDLRS